MKNENVRLRESNRSKDLEISKLTTKLDSVTKGWERTKADLVTTKEQLMNEKRERRNSNKRVRNREAEIVMSENCEQKARVLTKEGKRYSSETVKTAIALKTMGVSDENVGPVIDTVMREMTGQCMSHLPSAATVGRAGYVQLALARAHNKTVLEEGMENYSSKQEGMTVCSDETTKRTVKYQAFNVTVTNKDGDTRNQLLEIREVASKDATTSMNTFLSILDDIDRTGDQSAHDPESPQFRDLVIGSINAAMGDRASTQIKFSQLVQEYRSKIIPSTISGWDTMSSREKKARLTFLTLPCFVHIVASMAEPIWNDFAKHEYDMLGTQEAGEGRGSAVTLIRSMMKHFGPRSAALTTTYRDYEAWSKCTDTKMIRLPTLKGKRFNVIPKAATIIFTHKVHFKNFMDIYKADRVKPMREGMENELFMAQMHVLALVDCYLASPIWTIANDSKMNVLDTAKIIGEFLQWVDERTRDPKLLFDGVPPNLSVLFSTDIFERQEYDNLFVMKYPASTSLSFVVAKRAMLIVGQFLRRVFAPFLTGGEIHSLCAAKGPQSTKIRKAFASAPRNNVQVEGAFGLADYIGNRAPRMRTTRIAAETMMRRNKTMPWLNSLPDREQENLLNQCISMGPTLEKEGKAAKNAILEKVCEKMLEEAKIETNKAVHIQSNAERHIDDLFTYGGFFSTPDDLDNFLKRETNEARVLEAMRTQLRVRSKVLNQSMPGSKNFTLSEGSIPISKNALIEKVKRAIEQDQRIPVNTFSNHNVMNLFGDYDHVCNSKQYPITILNFMKTSKNGTPFALLQYQMGTQKKVIWTEELFTKDIEIGALRRRNPLVYADLTYLNEHDYCGGDGSDDVN